MAARRAGFLAAAWLAFVLTAVAAAAPALPILARDGDGTAGYVPDRFEIRLAPAASARVATARRASLESEGPGLLGVASIDQALLSLGASITPEFRGESPPLPGSGDPDFTAFYLVHLPPHTALEPALARFAALPEVVSVDPIAVLPVSATPNDSLFPASWWFRQADRHDVHAPEAWDVTTGDPRVVIAILDTGILPDHPDLGTIGGDSDRLWTNPAEAQGSPNVDDDGNGFVDDLWGWDFVNLGSNFRIPRGEDWADEDNDPRDFAGHGTIVAGLAGARTNNVKGVAGMTWSGRLMAVRMGWSRNDAPLGLVDMSYAAQAIRYATRMGADVINCSFATRDQSGLFFAASAAVRAGITLVVAAGNEDQLHDLAEREDVIAVAATDAGDYLASFSNRGPFVDVAAPGDEMVSTFVEVPRDTSGRCQPAYAAGLDGTSFAAPLVAGVAALVHAHRLQTLAPRLTPMGMLLRLRETTDDIAALNGGPEAGYGTGRLNAWRALVDPEGSTAIAATAATVGPGVAFRRLAVAQPFEAWATADARFVLRRVGGEIVAEAPLVAAPVSGVAAADLAPGRNGGFFVALAGNRVAGFDADARPLPGWPVTAAGSTTTLTLPALGDLDGDGAIDVVCGAANGRIFAWRTSGVPVTGFPRALGVPLVGPPALADLDGAPGVEIVAADELGNLHVLQGDGAPFGEGPVSLGVPITTPLVMRVADDSLAIVVAAGDQLLALDRQGGTRWAAPLGPAGAFAAQDLAAGDLDGDGRDDVVALTGNPPALVAVDGAGSPLGAFDPPRALVAPATGPPVIGRVHGAGDTLPDVLFMTPSGLVAIDAHGRPLIAFPKPGGAGRFPTLARAAEDTRHDVLAGVAGDSLKHWFTYAGAPGSGGNAPPWPTPRADFARTGSRNGAPPLSAIDDLAPRAVLDLAVDSVGTDAVVLAWQAPGDDQAVGRAAFYEVRVSTTPIDAGNFPNATLVDGVPTPRPAGELERHRVRGLADSVTYWFALRVHDDAGNVSPLSNVVQVTTAEPPAPPAVVTLAPRRQPSRVPVTFAWSGLGGSGQRIDLHDVFGRRVRVLELGAETGGAMQWNGRDDRGRSVPAGVYVARLTSGSLRAHTRVVLLP